MLDTLAIPNLTDAEVIEHYADMVGKSLAAAAEKTEKLFRPRPRLVYPTVCPACRGTGGGVYNDCVTCGGNGEV